MFYGNGYPYVSSFTRCALNGNFAVVLLDNLAGDSQAKPGTAFLGGVKRFKYFFDAFGRDAAAAVAEGDPDVTRIGLLCLYCQSPPLAWRRRH